MPLPQQPYSQIPYSDRVRNTNPVGSWSQIHPTTQKYLVENYGVDPKGTNWMQQPSNLRDAVARYPLATVKGMAAQGRLNMLDKSLGRGGANQQPMAHGNNRSMWPDLSDDVKNTLMNKYYVDSKGSNLNHVFNIRPGLSEAIKRPDFSTIDPNTFKFSTPSSASSAKAARPQPALRQSPMAAPKPIQPAAALRPAEPNLPPPATPSQTTLKQGATMTDKQMFKVAFLSKCIEDGLSLDEIKVRVKQALYFAEKKAGVADAFVDLIKTMPLVAGAGLGAAGAGGYYLGNKIIGPGIHEAVKPPIPDKEDMLREELINEYDRQTDIIKRQAELARRKRLRDMNISGVTRY